MYDEIAAARVARMAAARTHLEDVIDGLDLGENECECCSARRYANFDDNQLGKKLSGMISKLDNEINKLRGGAKKGRGDFHAKETRR